MLSFQTGITFGHGGNLKDFSPTGFSLTPHEVSTWSEAPMAELAFRLPPVRSDLRFSIEVFPFLGNGVIPQQGCWIFFNGGFVSYASVRAATELNFSVPLDLLYPRLNRLSFAFPNAVSPRELNIGDDLRLLGLSFLRLSAGTTAA
jgi:hypothetical protein